MVRQMVTKLSNREWHLHVDGHVPPGNLRRKSTARGRPHSIVADTSRARLTTTLNSLEPTLQCKLKFSFDDSLPLIYVKLFVVFVSEFIVAVRVYFPLGLSFNFPLFQCKLNLHKMLYLNRKVSGTCTIHHEYLFYL